MALQNPKLFGYEIKAALTDVSDPSLALRRLNVAPFDLEVIRGSANEGMLPNDWRSFSRLKVPLVKTTDRYRAESSLYIDLIGKRAGTNSILFGNLDVNGSISGKAIRYSYVKFNESNSANSESKIADISTSRVSAWSSSDARATNNDLTIQQHASISYGAQVGIATASGTLVYGTQGSAKTVDGTTYNDCLGPRLQTSIVPQKKEFNSETPTHKIKVKLGTTDVWLYAMKGIPYSVKGFFRNVDAEFGLKSLKNSTAASWKVVETGNSNSYVNFPDRGGVISSIEFRSPVSRERFIQFYYDPDYISSVKIQGANIAEIPEIKLEWATTFDLYYNEIKNLPDFNFLTPRLTSINLHRNPLYLSETESERFLNPTTIAKFPTSITNFQMGGTWYGSIRGQTTGTGDGSGAGGNGAYSETGGTYTSKDLIVRRFSNLTSMDLYRNGGGYHYSDDVDTAYIPNVPSTCTSYNIGNNDFTTFGSTRTDNGSNTSHFPNGSYTVETALNLQSLNLYSNYNLSKTGFSIASPVISSINIYNTNLPLPNCIGKEFLNDMQASWCRNAYSFFNTQTAAAAGHPTYDANAKTSMSGYKFDGCGALTTLNLSYSNLKNDRFPKFTNPSLVNLWLYGTNIRGGKPDGTETNVIAEDTFELCPNLAYIQILSGNLLSSPIHQYAFIKCAALYYFYYYSYGVTTGNLPDFTANGNLRYLQMMNNNFGGGIPTFAGSPSIYYVNLADNNLTGPIPSFANLTNLTYLYLYNNNFTSLGTFSGLGSLYRFEAHNNDMGGTIPDFTACSNLYYLILFNNRFSSYTSGSFVDLRRIKYIDLANNNLSQQAVNSIVADMYLNYQTYGSGRRITLNLRGNATPSEEAIETIVLLRQTGWTITFT